MPESDETQAVIPLIPVEETCKIECEPREQAQYLAANAVEAMARQGFDIVAAEGIFACWGWKKCQLASVCGLSGQVNMMTAEGTALTVGASFRSDLELTLPGDNPLQS